MANQSVTCARETRLLVVAVTDFLRDQIISRSDLIPEDKNCLKVAIDKLLTAYGAEGSRYVTYRGFRPLLDVFRQVINPVSVRDKIQADCHKERGNNYMKRLMFEKAETEYTKAIELDKWDAIYYTNRASAKIEHRKIFGAIPDCRQSLMISPDYAKAHARLGQAYALLHRPSDAARCFGKALDLEPENERYRNNLRVAENEINRPGPLDRLEALGRPDALGRPNAAQIINNLLGSLFRLGPQIAAGNNYTMIPTSITIIAENHSPVSSTQTAQKSKNSRISKKPITKNGKRGKKSSLSATNSINNITFGRSYGVTNEAEETGEFMINIPLPGFDATTRIQSSFSQDESRFKNAETVGRRPSEKLQINVQDEKTLPQRESKGKPNGLVNAHARQCDFKDNIIQQDEVLHDETHFSDKRNDTQSEKETAQTSTSEVKDKSTDAKKKKVKKDDTTLFNVSDSSTKAFKEQQSETSRKCINDELKEGEPSVKNLLEEEVD